MDTRTLQERFGIAGRVSVAEGNGGLPRLTLSHGSGSEADLYPYGAHLTAWRDTQGDDRFFLSRQAYFERGRPIRGGIPVVFPQFGSAGPLPQHGFARVSEWSVLRSGVDAEGRVRLSLGLSETPNTLALWPYRFRVELDVCLDADALAVDLRVQNRDDRPFPFMVALHTYFVVADVQQAQVRGLKGVRRIDTLRNDVRETETDDAVRFDREVDRIYAGAPDHVFLRDEARGRTLAIEKSGMPDVVVWNPWIEKSKRMPDFGDDEYLRMVCVETGIIEQPLRLAPGAQWQGHTRFRATGG